MLPHLLRARARLRAHRLSWLATARSAPDGENLTSEMASDASLRTSYTTYRSHRWFGARALLVSKTSVTSGFTGVIKACVGEGANVEAVRIVDLERAAAQADDDGIATRRNADRSPRGGQVRHEQHSVPPQAPVGRGFVTTLPFKRSRQAVTNCAGAEWRHTRGAVFCRHSPWQRTGKSGRVRGH